MIWWLWILLGLALLLLELLTPGGFFVLFFGVAALVVGALVGLDLGGPTWVQWLLFSTLSIASLLLFRDPLLARIKKRQSGSPSVDSLAGQIAVLLEDLPAGAVGKAELRGTGWSVRSRDARAMSKGQRCIVEDIEGLTLWVRPEQPQGG